MKKLNEVKETYAKELGYKDWETCINDQPNYKVEALMDKVALRLYGVVSTSKCDHEPKSPNRKYTSCKKCNMHLQMKP